MLKFKPLKKLMSKKVKFFKWKVKISLIAVLILLLLVLLAGGLGYAIYANRSDDNAGGSNTAGGASTSTNGSNTSPTNGGSTSSTLTPTPTPDNQGGGGNTPTPTPTPTAGPAGIVFAVTGVTASADPTGFCYGQYGTVNFSGTITANAAGTVSYYWLASDNGTVSGTINFASAGTQTVTTSWYRLWGQLVTMNKPSIFARFLSFFEGRAYALPWPPEPITEWQRLVVTSPNSISSDPANVIVSIDYCPN